MTQDFVEDAAQSLAKHESGYIMIAHVGGGDALCFSGRVETLEQLEWMRKRLEVYLLDLARRMQEAE